MFLHIWLFTHFHFPECLYCFLQKSCSRDTKADLHWIFIGLQIFSVSQNLSQNLLSASSKSHSMEIVSQEYFTYKMWSNMHLGENLLH